MTGEELRKKLKETGISQAEIARRLGTIPETIGQKFEAKDIKTGFLEDLCKVLEVNMSFFYGGDSSQVSDELEKAKTTIKHLYEAVEQLQEDNSRLKSEIIHLQNPDRDKRESEIYRLWMEHMKITERMQELYKIQKEG